MNARLQPDVRFVPPIKAHWLIPQCVKLILVKTLEYVGYGAGFGI